MGLETKLLLGERNLPARLAKLGLQTNMRLSASGCTDETIVVPTKILQRSLLADRISWS